MFNPSYGDVSYTSGDAVLGSIVATSLNAYTDVGNNKYNITVGASSNVTLEAQNNVNVFFSSGNAFNIYETVATSNSTSSSRVDSLMLNVVNSNSVTHITTAHTPLLLSGADSSNTTSLGHSTFFDDGMIQYISTPLSGGFEVTANMLCTGTFNAVQGIVSEGNIASVNSFAQTYNMYRNFTATTAAPVSAVGYSWNINVNGMLELIQFSQKSTGGTGVTFSSKRVGAWGSVTDTSITHSNTTAVYGVLGQFLGTLPTNTNVNGYTQGITGGGGAPTFIANSLGDVSMISLSNNLGIGLSNPTVKLDVVGTVRSSVSMMSPAYTIISDRRLKENIVDAASTDFIGLIDKIGVFTYNLKDDADHRNRFGWIAQDVQTVIPDAVLSTPYDGLDDCLQLDTDVLLAVLFGAVKQLKAEVASMSPAPGSA